MIGDNPAADIGGAKAAGMLAILVHSAAESDADASFASLRGAAEFLCR